MSRDSREVQHLLWCGLHLLCYPSTICLCDSGMDNWALNMFKSFCLRNTGLGHRKKSALLFTEIALSHMTRKKKQNWNIQQPSRTKWYHANNSISWFFSVTNSAHETLLETFKLCHELHCTLKNQVLKRPNTSDVNLKVLTHGCKDQMGYSSPVVFYFLWWFDCKF